MKRIRVKFKPFTIIIKLPNIFWRNDYTGFGWPRPFIFQKELNEERMEKLTLFHEKIHHEQAKKERWPFAYIIKYLYYARTKGYMENPFEIEARNRTAGYYYQQRKKGLM